MASLELEARIDNLLFTAQSETADLDLFAPIPLKDECPICMIPLSIYEEETSFFECCGKSICAGCIWKNIKTDRKNGVPDNKQKCAFCRQPSTKNIIKALKKLMKKNNTQAFLQMAIQYESGELTLQSNTKALEMRIRAAELGNTQAYTLIAHHYANGNLLEQNMSRVFEFLEIAAKKGSFPAHNMLAIYEDLQDINKCIKHRTVAASAGHKESLDELMKAYKDNLLSKEELTQTLRAFQVSTDLTKSQERDDAAREVS